MYVLAHCLKVSLKVAMSLSDIPNLWVPLALLGLIVLAAVYFNRSS
jgi:hypothetical protein